MTTQTNHPSRTDSSGNGGLTVAQVTEMISAIKRLPVNPGPASGDEVPGLLHGGWYTTEEVAGVIGVDASTLRRWRTSTPLQGPPFVRLTSRVVMYSVPDVEAWLVSRRVDPAKAA